MAELGDDLNDTEMSLRDLVRTPSGVVVASPVYPDHPLAYRYDQPVFPPPLAVLPPEEPVVVGDETPAAE